MPNQRATDIPCSAMEASPAVLEDLVPLAAVIGAGCEPCAVKMVERAVHHRCPKPSLQLTLRILAELSAGKCLATAVGPEVVDRMQRALRAGREALDRRRAPQEGPACCG